MKANLKTEAVAGLTTFLTMAYIIVVNPSILAAPGTGMPFAGVLTATVLLSFLMTLFMGLYAKLPFAVAPGMGINAFFTYSLVLGQKIPWPTALGMVFWSGVLFLVLSVLPIRARLAKAIPQSLRASAAVGIGLFLTFIGLRNAGLVVADPVTFVKLGPMDRKVILSMAGLAVTVLMLRRKNPFSFLTGIFTVTIAAWALGLVEWPRTFLTPPDFTSVLLQLDFTGSLKVAFIPTILALCFTDLFDSISTFVGVSQATGLVDEKGEPKNLDRGLLVDAWATLGAGLLGTSSGTAYIESTAGIEAGGRTGWTSVFTALCFLPCLFLSPIAAMVPSYATAPVLILVGALMFRTVDSLSLRNWEDLLPTFLTISLIPLTFSITQGILWGFITYVPLYWLAGRRKEIDPLMYPIAIISIVLLVIVA